MTSRWKFSTETKRSINIDSSKENSVNLRKTRFSMLSSFPFRYPFASDGCTPSQTTTSSSPQQGSPKNISNASSLIVEEISSSSLIGRYCSGSNEEFVNKRNSYIESSSKLFKTMESLEANSIDKNLFYVNDYDDYDQNRSHLYEEKRDVFIDTFNHDKINYLESVQSEQNFANLYSVNTLPNKDFDDISGLKRYGVRRHHSAPQPDAKWLQVSLERKIFLNITKIIFKLFFLNKIF